MQWAALLEDNDYRRVAWDEVGPYVVSTVWLGIDYGFGRTEVPLIFETMVFDTRRQIETPSGPVNESAECWRWPTEMAARAGHDQAVAWARERTGAPKDTGP